MAKENIYIENHIPKFYRKSILDVMIFTWIDCQRTTIPGISVENSALSFLKHQNIPEEELTIAKITQTFFRIQKELIDERKTKQ